MPVITFPVNSIVWILISLGFVFSISWVKKYLGNQRTIILLFLSVCFLAFYTLKSSQVARNRSINITWRNSKIHNTRVYKNLNLDSELNSKVILNCKNFKDVEMMIFRNVNDYHWFPKERELDYSDYHGLLICRF